MLRCDQQTYKDLEFGVIQDLLHEYCIGSTAKRRAKNLRPVRLEDELKKFLFQTAELTAIKREGEPFPHLSFEELEYEIKNLPIKNTSLPIESFRKIRQASTMVNTLLFFFKKRKEEYPYLFTMQENIPFSKEILQAIDKIFDPHGLIKDNASPLLASIRSQMQSVKRQSNGAFDRCVRKYIKKGYLSDTKESYIDHRRVLAVQSSFKREVNGRVLDTSKSGNVTFIEPGETIPINREYEQLEDDERKEIFNILLALTDEMRTFLPLIQVYQQVLVQFDFILAKTKLALLLDASLPGIHYDKKMDLMQAYHPILKLKNKETGKKTIPQHIVLNKKERMLVISGPNAGGKSITLKTVGLLQLMLQCGLLVPVHPNSKMCLFEALLTDIGDNQSIENELSTYSYRLKRMHHFLSVADENSLLLLDEFGTGSDPELGGALAEVFFETLYEKQSFGVITTHYGNIKLKADELPEAMNGCMLFDTKTLQPLFQFSMGQPGSSFTFEVAQINGISTELINKAKAKLDSQRVKMDELLHDLQKERAYLNELAEAHVEAQEITEEHRIYHQESQEKYEEKLQQIKDRAGKTEKYVRLGQKMQQFIDRFKVRSKKKNVNQSLMEEVKKYIAIEKNKIEEIKTAERLKRQAKKHKKKTKKKQDAQKKHQQHRIKTGSTVKLISSKQKGEVEEINGANVTVLFGFARMKVKLEQLQWVSDK